MSRTPTASDWVRSLPRGARVDWRELEAHVLREHPAVLRELGAAGRVVRSRSAGWRLGFGALLAVACVVGLAVVWAPIWGLATLAGDAFGRVDVDGATAIPVAGASMILGGLVQAVLLARTLSRRAAGDGGGVGAGIAVLGALIAVGTWVVGNRQDVPGTPAWVGIALLAATIAGVHAVVARRLRPDRASASAHRVAAAPDPDAAARRVGELPGPARAALEEDRRAAVEQLRMHGAISPEEAAVAMRVELGRLGATLGR